MRYGRDFFCTDGKVHYGAREVGTYHFKSERQCIATAVIGNVKIITFGVDEYECAGLLRRSYESMHDDTL